MTLSIIAISTAKKFFFPLFDCFLTNGFLLFSSSLALDRSISKWGCIWINKCWWCVVYVFKIFFRLLVIISRLIWAICWEVFHLEVRLMLYCGVSSTFYQWDILYPRYIDFHLVKVSYGGGLSVVLMEMLLWNFSTFWTLIYIHGVVWTYLFLC